MTHRTTRCDRRHASRSMVHHAPGKTTITSRHRGLVTLVALRRAHAGGSDMLGVSRDAGRTGPIVASVATTSHRGGSRGMGKAGTHPSGVIGRIGVATVALITGDGMGRRLAGRIGAVVTAAAIVDHRQPGSSMVHDSGGKRGEGCSLRTGMAIVALRAGRDMLGKGIHAGRRGAVVAAGTVVRTDTDAVAGMIEGRPQPVHGGMARSAFRSRRNVSRRFNHGFASSCRSGKSVDTSSTRTAMASRADRSAGRVIHQGARTPCAKVDRADMTGIAANTGRGNVRTRQEISRTQNR